MTTQTATHALKFPNLGIGEITGPIETIYARATPPHQPGRYFVFSTSEPLRDNIYNERGEYGYRYCRPTHPDVVRLLHDMEALWDDGRERPTLEIVYRSDGSRLLVAKYSSIIGSHWLTMEA
jgi:hypothetical protein